MTPFGYMSRDLLSCDLYLPSSIPLPPSFNAQYYANN